VLDLPQLYAKPSADDLLKTLELLAIQPKSFGIPENVKRTVQPAGISRYLTSIVASALAWIPSDELREAVWDAAAARLSERAGRTGNLSSGFLSDQMLIKISAMPALSRVFKVPTSTKEEVTLTVHEPSLTSDNLGMKTWASSYLLSQRLYQIIDSVPELVPSESTCQRESSKVRALELGSGTGLVGLSYAIVYGASATIHLTDLPAIVPNLTHNVSLNTEALGETSAQVTTGVLDWSVISEPAPENNQRYDIILAADPLYSPEHPKWLVQTIGCWLSRGLDARVVVEMPLREAYLPQVEEFRRRMGEVGLAVVEQGEEVGYDDWEGANGDSVEVHCWWSVWGWSEKL
jgi:hypothetical protein